MHRQTFGFVLLVVLLGCVAPGFAGPVTLQSDDAAADKQRSEVEALRAEVAELQSRREEKPGAPPISLSFKGGTVEQYVDLIRDVLHKSNAEANVLLKAGVENLPVPPVELKDVTLDTALQVLHGYRTDVPGGVAMIDLDLIRGPSSAPIYTLSVKNSSTSSTEQMVHVWNISRSLAAGVKADDTLTAIETALGLVRSSGDKPEVRFHEATGLIIARGDGEQISAIDQIIDRLADTAQTLANSRDREQELQRARQALGEVKQLQKQAELSNDTITQRERARDEALRQVVELKGYYEPLLGQLRAKQVEMEAQQAQSQMQIVELNTVIQDLRKKLEQKKPNEG